jgi:glucose/arabinose dehydrogenase
MNRVPVSRGKTNALAIVLPSTLVIVILFSSLPVTLSDVNSGTPMQENQFGSITEATENNAARPRVTSPTVYDPLLEVQLVYDGLESPTSMEFVGLDDILVLEKNDGTVRRIINGVMLDEPILDVHVANLVERGMLGIAIAENANDHAYVFLYYTQSPTADGEDASGIAPLGNRLYRYELVDNELVNGKLLLDIDASRGASHNGGKILIGPDNNVYLTVGDIAGHRTLTQNYQNSSQLGENGVIYRITQDGKSAGGILGREEPLSKYYAYGIRNSFGMDFDPLSGKLWDTENGPTYGDEINLVEPGFNSGWARVSGISDPSFNPSRDLVECIYCINYKGFVDLWIIKYIFGIQNGRYSEPEFTWSNVVGPTAIKFMTSDKLGTYYENDMFVADFVNGRIYHFELNEKRDDLVLEDGLSERVANTTNALDHIVFAEGFGGITDMDVGPDGHMYILAYYDDPAIYRIVPKGTPLPFSEGSRNRIQ